MEQQQQQQQQQEEEEEEPEMTETARLEQEESAKQEDKQPELQQEEEVQPLPKDDDDKEEVQPFPKADDKEEEQLQEEKVEEQRLPKDNDKEEVELQLCEVEDDDKEEVELQLRQEEEEEEQTLPKDDDKEEEQQLGEEKEEQEALTLPEDGDSQLELSKEEQEGQLGVEKDGLQLPKEKENDLPLTEEVDNLQLQEKEEGDNLQLLKGECGDDLQLPNKKEDTLQSQEEEDNVQLSKEEKGEEQGMEEDLAPVKEEDRPEENGKERDIDNSAHFADSDVMTIDNQCENVQEVDDDAQLTGPTSPADADTGVADSDETGGDVNMEDAEVETEVDAGDVSKGNKRKRGKPQGKMRPTPPTQRKKKDEEDVCFICFDGGSLVLCDRRGCPKAYHLACIKRDEAFFRSKAKWNCDWHICSSCQKASHYMCYSCTYSVCKGCIKDSDYVCVRGNKGFCGACMKTIMLIENIAPANTEMVQVDFDDKNSWEYLFKDYWIDLKAKLSLTVDELTKAKNPWKGDELPKAKSSGKGIGSSVTPPKEVFSGDDEKDPSLDNGGNVEGNRSKRRKTKDRAKILYKQNSPVMADSDVDEVTPLTKGTTWATKELLDFVAHMRNGDTSVVSQFDVQALLVEYIKRNNLRDPRQKSQIICDSRLRNLFGQPRVGHFEMLKLLENHFLIKEKSPADDSVRVGISDAAGSDEEAAESSDSRNDRRRKTRKKMNGRRSRINPNSEEYAAIDVHNINLLYLKRNLIENLMDDTEKFHEMVVGSFVRIRISGGDQKQNMYRLVPVVGTSKVDESYKVGSRTTDFMLEILNLDKKEVVSIDGISNQEFLEDECRRLRQSIKCGLIKRLKVGEIQEKATALQPVKVTDWLQAEIARLNHLRDRASEKGRRKELRECVEKLELLKSPKERQRRLHEIPDVHIDPNMDPSYESEEDAGESDEMKQGDHVRPRNTGFSRRVLERNSSIREGDLNDVGNRAQRNLATVSVQGRNISTTPYMERESRWGQGGGTFGLNNQNTPKNQLSATGLVSSDWNNRAAVRSESYPGVAPAAVRSESYHGVAPAAVRSESYLGAAPAAIPSPLSSGREIPRSDFETEKIWHYKDPSGNIQGPFSIIQLRKWNIKGHFPPHFRVWRTNERQEDSILLTDALDGRFPRT